MAIDPSFMAFLQRYQQGQQQPQALPAPGAAPASAIVAQQQQKAGEDEGPPVAGFRSGDAAGFAAYNARQAPPDSGLLAFNGVAPPGAGAAPQSFGGGGMPPAKMPMAADFGPPQPQAPAPGGGQTLTIQNGANVGVAQVNPDGSIAPQAVADANRDAGHVDLTGRPRTAPAALPNPGASNALAAMGPIRPPVMPDFSPRNLMQAADSMYGNWRQMGASSAPADPLAGARAGLTEQYQQQLAQYNQQQGNQTELEKARIGAAAHVEAANVTANAGRLANSAPYQVAKAASAEAIRLGLSPQDTQNFIRSKLASFPQVSPDMLGEYAWAASPAAGPGTTPAAGPGAAPAAGGAQPLAPSQAGTQNPLYADLPRQLSQGLLGTPGAPAATPPSAQALVQAIQANAQQLGPQGVSALMSRSAEQWPGGPQKFEQDLLSFAADQARTTGAGQFKNMQFTPGGFFGNSNISVGGLSRQLPVDPLAATRAGLGAALSNPQKMQDRAKQLSALIDAINLYRGEPVAGTGSAPTLFGGGETIRGMDPERSSLMKAILQPGAIRR